MLVGQLDVWPCLSVFIKIKDAVPIRMGGLRVLEPEVSCGKHGTIQVLGGKTLRSIALENRSIVDISFGANIPHPFPKRNHCTQTPHLAIGGVRWDIGGTCEIIINDFKHGLYTCPRQRHRAIRNDESIETTQDSTLRLGDKVFDNIFRYVDPLGRQVNKLARFQKRLVVGRVCFRRQ